MLWICSTFSHLFGPPHGFDPGLHPVAKISLGLNPPEEMDVESQVVEWNKIVWLTLSLYCNICLFSHFFYPWKRTNESEENSWIKGTDLNRFCQPFKFGVMINKWTAFLHAYDSSSSMQCLHFLKLRAGSPKWHNTLLRLCFLVTVGPLAQQAATTRPWRWWKQEWRWRWFIFFTEWFSMTDVLKSWQYIQDRSRICCCWRWFTCIKNRYYYYLLLYDTLWFIYLNNNIEMRHLTFTTMSMFDHSWKLKKTSCLVHAMFNMIDLLVLHWKILTLPKN